jgi:hypothetical protein
MLFLSDSARIDFSDLPSSPPHNAILIGIAPDDLNYHRINEAYRLLMTDKSVPLIATHKALFYVADDAKLSLGPGSPHIHLLSFCLTLPFFFLADIERVSPH